VAIGGLVGEHLRLAGDFLAGQPGDGFERHVAVLQLPLVVLLQEHGADEADGAGLVGEDADDGAAPLDLLVEPFERVGRVQLGPVLAREARSDFCTSSKSATLSSVIAIPFGSWLSSENQPYRRFAMTTSPVGR